MEISKSIFKGCKKMDRQAQEGRYRSLYNDLMRISIRYVHSTSDAEDIINRAMLKVFTKINEFNGSHKNLGGWIRRITVNESIDFIRRNKTFSQNQISIDTTAEPSFTDINLEHDPNEILNLLKQLPNLTATVFNLFAIEGYSHKEIGELLKITEGNSKWHLHQARQKLQLLIKENQLL